MNVDLSKNPKQESFFNTVIEAVHGLNDKRVLGYGGAIRGGKTFVSLSAFAFMAKTFKGSRWHVLRSDFPALQKTSIPSMEKILAGTSNWKWNRDKSNYFAYHQKSDGKIFFMGENIDRDPELTNFLGLETNGILFEQIEELSEKTFEIGMSRNGSWYIDPMPVPVILFTVNPTQTWIKKKVYDLYRKGMLKPPFYYQEALPNDNPFVTKEQWAAWSQMADRYQKQFIQGDWTDFGNKDDIWAFSFNYDNHVGYPVLNRNYPVYLSFDFNRNPACCSVIQWYNNKIRVIETIKLAGSGTDGLCRYILSKYMNCLFIVNGDYSGNTASSLYEEEITNYKVIKQVLGISQNQIKIKPNPRLKHNAVLVNSLLSNYPIEIHEKDAAALIYDFQNVRKMADGTIEKTDRKDPSQQADALDTFRYFCNMNLGDFIEIPQS